GRTVLFVSHSMAAIQNLCSRVAVLDRGQLVFAGDCPAGINYYMNRSGTPAGGDVDVTRHPLRRAGSKPILQHLRLLNLAGEPACQFAGGEPLTLELEADIPRGMADANIAIIVEDALGGKLFTVGSHLTGQELPLGSGQCQVVCRLDSLPLSPGRYAL